MSLITVIDELPTTITPEEHRERTATTPASFSDIPPVLRYKEDNVRVVLEPPIDGLSDEELKNGKLYIIESVLAYASASTGRGFRIEYPCISLHAVSRNDPNPYIYCQLDEPLTRDCTDMEGDEDEAEVREIRIIPESPASLDKMFEALSQCAALHPDPLTGSDMADDDAFIDASSEYVQEIIQNLDAEPDLSESGRAILDRLELLIQDPQGYLTRTNGSSEHHEKEAGISDNEGHQAFADAET